MDYYLAPAPRWLRYGIRLRMAQNCRRLRLAFPHEKLSLALNRYDAYQSRWMVVHNRHQALVPRRKWPNYLWVRKGRYLQSIFQLTDLDHQVFSRTWIGRLIQKIYFLWERWKTNWSIYRFRRLWGRVAYSNLLWTIPIIVERQTSANSRRPLHHWLCIEAWQWRQHHLARPEDMEASKQRMTHKSISKLTLL